MCEDGACGTVTPPQGERSFLHFTEALNFQPEDQLAAAALLEPMESAHGKDYVDLINALVLIEAGYFIQALGSPDPSSAQDALNEFLVAKASKSVLMQGMAQTVKLLSTVKGWDRKQFRDDHAAVGKLVVQAIDNTKAAVRRGA